MKRFANVIVSHLSPGKRDVVCGAGLGYDPTPRSWQDTFIDSDIEAFAADLKALYLDWCRVQDRVAVHFGERSTESTHRQRYSGRTKERSEEREKRVIA